MGRLRKAKEFLEETEARGAAVPARAQPSLARDALVVSINPADGKPWNGAQYVVPAALMVELAHEGRLEVSGSGKRTEVQVRDPTPLGDPELDDALVSINSGVFGHQVRKLVNHVPHTADLLKRLVAEGVLEQETHQRLGLFTVHRYRPTPAAGRDQLVARLRSAMLGESVPDERTALLSAVLVGIHPKVYVPKDRVRDARAHYEEVHGRLSDGERAIVEAVDAALTDDSTSGVT